MSPTKGLIIQYGLIGDCILSLPLASFLRDTTSLDSMELLAFPKYSAFLERRSLFGTVHDMNRFDLHRLHAERYVPPHETQSIVGRILSEFNAVFAFVHERWSHYTDNLRVLCQLVGCKNFYPLTFVPPDRWKNHVIEWHIRQFQQLSKIDPPEFKDLFIETMIQPIKRDLEWGQAFLKSLGIDPSAKILAIHPGSGVRWKNIHIDNFIEIGRRFQETDTQVLYFIGPAEKPWMDAETRHSLKQYGHICETNSFATILGVLAQVSLVVCNDSAFSHIAAGIGTHTLTLFGPTLADWYRPIGPNVTTIQCQEKSLHGLDEELLCQMMKSCWKLKL